MFSYLAGALFAIKVIATGPPKHVDETDIELYDYEEHGADWGNVLELEDNGEYGTEKNWPGCGTG